MKYVIEVREVVEVVDFPRCATSWNLDLNDMTINEMGEVVNALRLNLREQRGEEDS